VQKSLLALTRAHNRFATRLLLCR